MWSGKHPSHHKDYVYLHANKGFDKSADVARNNKDVLLARVPKDSLADRAAYEFFSTTASEPSWSRDIRDAKSVFHDPKGVNWHIYCVYNPGIRRYLLLLEADLKLRY